jgi:hypothetical protein
MSPLGLAMTRGSIPCRRYLRNRTAGPRRPGRWPITVPVDDQVDVPGVLGLGQRLAQLRERWPPGPRSRWRTCKRWRHRRRTRRPARRTSRLSPAGRFTVVICPPAPFSSRRIERACGSPAHSSSTPRNADIRFPLGLSRPWVRRQIPCRLVRPSSFGLISARHLKPTAAVFLGYQQPEPHSALTNHARFGQPPGGCRRQYRGTTRPC